MQNKKRVKSVKLTTQILGQEYLQFYLYLFNASMAWSLGIFLTEHHAMKAYWGSECIAPRILWPRY
jgi:hypothetical protein